jgi:hypothetical protein
MSLGPFALNQIIYFRANTVNKQGSAVDAEYAPEYEVFDSDNDSSIINGTMEKVASYDGFYKASFLADDGSFSTGQHFILISAIVDGESPKIHIPFEVVKESQSIKETFDEIHTIGDAIPLIGQGSISIDHNYGSTDRFRVKANGTPIADVSIRAFVKTDYSAGLRANRYIVGQTKTRTDGRWASVVRLDPGEYTLEFSKTGQFKTTTTNLTVTA